MLLLTRAIENRLRKVGPQDVPNPIVICKLFTPDSSWTWYVTAGELIVADPNVGLEADWELFGWVCGPEQELGYFSLNEIGRARGPLGLHVERDQWFTECRLDEVKAKLEGGS